MLNYCLANRHVKMHCSALAIMMLKSFEETHFLNNLSLTVLQFKKAENLMLKSDKNKEYLPIEGLNAFNKATAELLHGADNPAIKQHRVATVQGLSGSGSLLLGNHKNIFNDAGVPWS
ncbi:aspartate aminotransferase, partial [Trifolium pratense]